MHHRTPNFTLFAVFLHFFLWVMLHSKVFLWIVTEIKVVHINHSNYIENMILKSPQSQHKIWKYKPFNKPLQTIIKLKVRNKEENLLKHLQFNYNKVAEKCSNPTHIPFVCFWFYFISQNQRDSFLSFYVATAVMFFRNKFLWIFGLERRSI